MYVYIFLIIFLKFILCFYYKYCLVFLILLPCLALYIFIYLSSASILLFSVVKYFSSFHFLFILLCINPANSFHYSSFPPLPIFFLFPPGVFRFIFLSLRLCIFVFFLCSYIYFSFSQFFPSLPLLNYLGGVYSLKFIYLTFLFCR